MENDLKKIKEQARESAEKFVRRRLFLTTLKIAGYVAAGLAVAVLLFAGASWTYAQAYRDRAYPGVKVGQYEVGGMNAKAVIEFIENLNNRLSKEGLTLLASVDGTETEIKISTVSGGDDSVEIVSLDSDVIARAALSAGRTDKNWRQWYRQWQYLFFGYSFPATVNMNAAPLKNALKEKLGGWEDNPHDARVDITGFNPLTYEIAPEQAGKIFDYDAIVKEISDNLSQLSFLPVRVAPQHFAPEIKAADALDIAPKLSEVLSYGNIGFYFIDNQTKFRRDWNLTPSQFASWLRVARDENNNLIFALQEESAKDYLEKNARPVVDKPMQDAKFVVEENKVKEFQASRAGLSLNAAGTFNELDRVFRERNYRPAQIAQTVSVVADAVEPNVKMADANNLGITDIIGVGISTFRDSHTNRIKNIAHAVARLNGTIIKPDEEFSAIKYAGPFTAENGFLPEDIIKGDEIKKEVGGGMCQIGTTLFRMAMNSGMPITERRNHSLVVGYYADPVNGNPGTDATLYEPILDFKFLNDTGNYLLLQADIDYERQQLTFTLWGKPDGRKGWYTHPVVSRWIPAGEPQEIKTDKLKPGEQKCQNAFRGAVASFTYSRVTPTGEKIDRVFNSYYRPLPKICMVGVDPSEICPEGQVCEIPSDSAASSTASTTPPLVP